MLNVEDGVAKRYEQLSGSREVFLERAREAAEITIPTLMPPSGHNGSTNYETPYQSVGSRGVNNLASKLLIALLPPNAPFFRLTIDDFDLQELAGPDARGKVEDSLARIERAGLQEIEGSAVRVPVFEGLKQLIVSGNTLLYMPKDQTGMKVYRMDRYVVKRDTMGNVLEIITKESVSPVMLEEDVRELLTDPEDKSTKDYDLYTCIKREKKKWIVYQEIEGIKIPGSEGTYKIDQCPFIPLRFIRVDGEDYGRGYVEEYLGDLKSLEALTRAIVEGSAAAAKVLFLVRPNGTTKQRVLAESSNGAIVSGDAQDVSTLKVDKGADFRVAMETMSMITERLSFAFLLNSSVQRNAERVTAEEVRYMAQELETALGGIYSILSQEFQMPLIKLLMARLEKQGKMPKLPENTIKPTVVTGLEALGRGQDLNKLASFLQYLQPLGPEVLMQELNVADYLDRLGASLGIDTSGLIKSPEQKQAEQQAAMEAQQQQMMQSTMASMAEKVSPEVAKAAMDSGK